jgi:DNA polymerase elongation subunit (family B)
MYSNSELKSMLFIDIETTSEYSTYEEFCSKRPGAVKHWAKKAEQHRNSESHLAELSDAEMYIHMAALSPEFSKVIVISIGQIKFEDDITTSKIRSFYGDNEQEILKEFMGTAQAVFNANAGIQFAGHNIKNFDFPYLIKRAIVNGVSVPHQFHLQKKKPWENCLVDTYEIWKFAGWNSASLDLICDTLNIPSPKIIMEASSTTEEYWNGNLEKIKTYCEGDVKATMNVMLKMSGLNMVFELPF